MGAELRRRAAAAALGLSLLLAGAAASGAERFELVLHHDVPWRDAPYADGKHLLDVYAPADADGAPVMLFVHGGGLLRGDKSANAHLGVRFARAGIVVVSVNHRLSPRVTHPAHVRDLARAFAWTRAHAARYGGDPDALVLAGHSAGAYLVALLATDARWLAEAGEDLEGVAGVVPISGFFHVPRLAPERPESVWGEDPATWRAASPARHVHESVPPTLLLFADGDTEARRRESRDFAAELRAAGAADVRLERIDDRDHVTIWSYLSLRDDPAARAIVDFVHELAGGGRTSRPARG